MLSAAHRLRASSDFAEVLRRGRRAGTPTVTVHLIVGDGHAPARAGLVVSKAVGGSVVRHHVARQLRHQLQPLVGALPTGTRLVVRASPAAAAADSAALGRDLSSALNRLVRA